MTVAFTKMQGIGNDFIVVDARERQACDWPVVAERMCRRHFGIGADGLLVIGADPDADARMDMYNPDGTPDFCGNGLRCVARYVADRQAPSGPSDLRIATMAGTRSCRVDRGPSSVAVTVDMGQPSFDPRSIPMAVDLPEVIDYPLALSRGSLMISALSTGTAHAVAFVEALPDDAAFRTVSEEVETHPLFPERTSLMWVRRDAPDRLTLRIWERGAGETLACGTGACAAAAAARRKGLAEGSVVVASAGGELIIGWEPDGRLRMTGPAEYVFEGSFPW